MLGSLRWLQILLVWGSAVLPSHCDMCDWRDKRDFRQWKGDAGDLETFPGGMVRDRLVLHHRRLRRFLSFPTGSVLTVTPQLTIPWVNHFDIVTSDQVYKFAFDLQLPNGTLRLSKFNSDTDGYGTQYGSNTETPSGTEYGNKYDDWYDTQHDLYPESSYSEGYHPHPYHRYDYHWSRKRRALDDQRLKGYKFMETLLGNMGIDGHECLLRIVCEIAEEPIEDLGLTGEIINLFFSAGFGSRVEELSEYIVAEESGRKQGDCESLYQACPYNLIAMLETALSYFHHGLSHVGNSQTNSLLL